DGAPSPEFESARPTVLRTRTDWIFRYRVPAHVATGDVVSYLNILFNGDRFTGWYLTEEYADGREVKGDSGSEINRILARFGVIYALLIVLLAIFLKKYHAGEVGVNTAALLFAVTLALLIISDFMMGPSFTESTGLGSLDAQRTAIADMVFKFVIMDV